MTGNTKKAFTLIELLVLIAIVAILLSILIPALQKAKMQCYQVLCAGNLRQPGAPLYLYAEDNRHRLPYLAGVTDYPTPGPNLYKLEGNGLDS